SRASVSETRDPYCAVHREGTAYGSPLSRRRPHQSLPPDLVRQLDNHAQLGPLLILGQHVAFFGRGEAALRRQAELIERDKFRGFFDALLDVRARLQAARLRRDQAKNHDLVALWQKPQRLKSAGAGGVVFEEVTVVVALAEEILRHRLVAAGRDEGRAEGGAADMGGGLQIGGGVAP